jgi:hypothetical protein
MYENEFKRLRIVQDNIHSVSAKDISDIVEDRTKVLEPFENSGVPRTVDKYLSCFDSALTMVSRNRPDLKNYLPVEYRGKR